MHSRASSLFFCLILVAGLWACVGLFNLGSAYDKGSLSVETVSLFSQRQLSRLGKKSWIGDWILRRARLAMIDQSLRNLKPDVLIAQELIEKRGSESESDKAILSAGALSSYSWRKSVVEEYADTQEQESFGIALASPHRFFDQDGDLRHVWSLGTTGYLAAAAFEFEGQPVDIFDVKMPSTGDDANLWYTFIQERVLERLRRLNRCGERVILAGYMPAGEDQKRYQDMLKVLGMKDTASGFCQIPSHCYTATPSNDLYLATMGDTSPARTDRILVPNSAYVYTARRIFDESDSAFPYIRSFGISHLWPTQRFGWVAQVRLGRCQAGNGP